MRTKCFFLALLTTAAANAGTILYNNIGDPYTTNSQLTETLAQSFSTGSSALSLDDLQLVLDIKAPDTGSFTIGLYSDNSTKPGTQLLAIATVSDTTLTSTATTYDFPVADYALAANTRYWIVLGLTNGEVEGSWESSNPQAGDTGVSGQYTDYGGSIYIVGPTTSPAFSMTIDAVSQTTTPEPSSALLLGAGLAAGAAFLRKARR
jgi:hypothetical protein